MPSPAQRSPFTRSSALSLVLAVIVMAGLMFALSASSRAPSAESSAAPAASAVAPASAMHMHGGEAMSDAAMEKWVRDWYAVHPASPSAVAAASAPVDTFFATGTSFDADHNLGTPQDVVQIFAGQSILWQWLNGSHTTTNGTGAGDPSAGLFWDSPLTVSAQQFVRRFDAVGTFPFFCRPHEALGMKGTVVVSAPADTFIASGTEFDTDGNLATQVDTTYIAPGRAVMWRLSSGIHTVTSGTGSTDPNVGKLFDVPLDSTAPVFTFTFPTLGTFPFFCRTHEGFNMRGVVIVTDQLSVPPGARVAGRLAFVTEPAPNPTRAGARFQFSIAQAGRVRAEVFDVAGQRVATVLDRELDPGTHGATWDGRTVAGTTARSGIYYLRLSAAGASLTRRIAVAH